MMTRNPHINLTHIRNLYSIDNDNLQACIIWSVRHFHTKHGIKPDTVLLHPDTINGCKGELTFTHESGEAYSVQVQADDRQGKTSFMVAKEE